MSKTVGAIGTHSGAFHADEALAVYMLRLLPKYKSHKVIRTRDNSKLENECEIVVDVGGKYDGEKWFDHHQKTFTYTFSSLCTTNTPLKEFNNTKLKNSGLDQFNNTKLSSAGLVYAHFGEAILNEILAPYLSENKIITNNNNNTTIENNPKRHCGDNESFNFTYLNVYKDFMQAIDANDNGVNPYENLDVKNEKFPSKSITIPGVVASLNPTWIELAQFENDNDGDKLSDERFELASNFVGKAFERFVISVWLGKTPARNEVKNAILNSLDNKDIPDGLLVLKRSCPWTSQLFDSEEDLNIVGKFKYVVYPERNNVPNTFWRIQAVPESPASFTSRKPLPQAWRGLRDEELSKLTGIQNCIFVHAAGFIGGNKTYDGVLQMAKAGLSA